MISYNYQIPQTPAIANSGYRVAPQVKSEQPSSSLLPTDGAVLGQSLNWVGTQPSQAPSILPLSSPESTVKRAPGQAGSSHSVPGLGQGAGMGTLTLGLESPAYSPNGVSRNEYRVMGLLLNAHRGQPISERDLEGLSERQKLDIQQVQLLAMTHQMSRVEDLRQSLTFRP